MEMNNESPINVLFKKITTFINPYHVSLSNYSKAGEINLPIGSGTFVQYCVNSNKVYGVLTAAHLIPILKREKQPHFISLSKHLNGKTIAYHVSYEWVQGIANPAAYGSNKNDSYMPDIAFIALNMDALHSNELIEGSKFYDLEGVCELKDLV